VYRPPEFDLDLTGLLRLLGDHEVTFIVIGGIAAVVNGSPFATEDLDITVEETQQNLGRLSDALGRVGAGTSERDPGDPRHTQRYVTTLGNLDVFHQPSGTRGYRDLFADARCIEALGLQFHVASLADVIRSKQAANRPKDQRVLPTLREILASRFAERDG
jgi:hypothetical protein